MIRTGMRVKIAMTAAAVLPALTLTAAAASAEPVAAAANKCGPRYKPVKKNPVHKIVRTYKVNGKKRTATGGYLRVYYNASNGNNCAVAETWDGGRASSVKLTMGRYNRQKTKIVTTVRDGFKKTNHYYSGPIYIWAANRCLYLKATIKRSGYTYSYVGKKVHCG